MKIDRFGKPSNYPNNNMTKKTSLFNPNKLLGGKQFNADTDIIASLRSNDKYGYENIFPIRNPFNPTDQHLNELAKFMTSRIDKSDSEIPAGYTYLSQFIAHDISLDSENRTDPWTDINPSTISNKRNPFFDLETIYGFDEPANSNETRRSDLLAPGSSSRLNLGETVGENTGGIIKPFPNDLPREANSSKPVIVDGRNDENLAVAQTQVAFIKFHNAIVKKLNEADTTELFEKARRIAIRHYQWIILHDFLPKIVKKSVLDDVLENSNKFYFPDPANPFLPLEFSFAAFRLGHSMVRNSYQWNRIFNEDDSRPHATLDQLAKFTHRGGGLERHKKLQSAWLINWNWFYDVNDSRNEQQERFNFARKIDGFIAKPLGKFRDPLALEFKRENSLPAFDLYRNRALGLPSGQAIARKMQEKIPVEILDPQELANLLPDNLKNIFKDETPLWFYILAEARIETLQNNNPGGTLGDVGSRIVAETFVELLKIGPHSILRDDLQSDEEFLGEDGIFGMPEMLKFIASKNEDFDELNPTKLSD